MRHGTADAKCRRHHPHFPALPSTWTATSKACWRGGFQVSADQVSGAISNVTITSTVGGNVSTVSPWTGRTLRIVDASTSGDVAYTTNNNIATFATTAGKTYLLYGRSLTPTGLRATQSGGQVSLAGMSQRMRSVTTEAFDDQWQRLLS